MKYFDLVVGKKNYSQFAFLVTFAVNKDGSISGFDAIFSIDGNYDMFQSLMFSTKPRDFERLDLSTAVKKTIKYIFTKVGS